MIALLRYSILKSRRENFLFALLFSPAIMILAPLLGTVAYWMTRGVITWPLSADPTLPASNTARVMGIGGSFLSTIAAGVGGFWIFRQEMFNRTLGFFILAVRPRSIAVAATIYGATAGVASYLVIVASGAALTAHLPQQPARQLLLTIACCLAASALGITLLSFSSEISMLMPVYAGSIALAGLVSTSESPVLAAAVAAGGGLLTTIASFMLRRRCAI